MSMIINGNGIGNFDNIFSDHAQNSLVLSETNAHKSDTDNITKLDYKGDVIELSEEAKKLAINNRDVNNNSETNPEPQIDGSSENMDQIQKLREQIQEIQQKIQEAQQRLIEAQASANNDSDKSDGDDANNNQNSMSGLLTQSAEVEQIQAEIEMLNQQLLTLNDQLKQAMQGTK